MRAIITKCALALALAGQAPLSAGAQGLGQAGAVSDTPRAIELFAGASGYSDLAPDIYGTPGRPNPTERGVLIALRLFRNVCLGLEAGAPLSTVLPPEFLAYSHRPYLQYEATPWLGGAAVVSSTGSLISDEDDGHPAIWVIPAPTGMTCTLRWDIYGIADDRKAAMAGVLENWAPFAFALVQADRPELSREGLAAGFSEWDRPCGGRWCPTTILFNFDRGSLSLETTLNITDIEGTRP